jgi:hypothetical protein
MKGTKKIFKISEICITLNREVYYYEYAWEIERYRDNNYVPEHFYGDYLFFGLFGACPGYCEGMHG